MKRVGVSVTVGSDPISRLSYFLDCVDACLPNLIPGDLIQYERSMYFDLDDRAAIVELALTLSPDLLLENVFFLVPLGHPSLNGRVNEFFEIQEATRTISAMSSLRGIVVVDGRDVTVNKVLFCTEEWYGRFYINPLKDARHMLERSQPVYQQIGYSSTSYYPPQPQPPIYAQPGYPSPSYPSPSHNKVRVEEVHIRARPLTERDREWLPDAASPSCMICYATFGVFTRRHHCRQCGSIFCSKCCPNVGGFWTRLCKDCLTLV